MPIRGYQAHVSLTGTANGTIIEWRGRFQRAAWPGLSRPLRFFTKTMLQKYANNLGVRAQQVRQPR
jgi:hypothetical protein